MEQLTQDAFFNGHLKMFQYRDGYRFSMDAVLLANSVVVQSDDRVLDLGTGCGIIPLILSARNPQVNILGVEIQESLFDVAGKNVNTNNKNSQINLILKDIKDLSIKDIKKPVQVVLSNPPFRKKESGRINPNLQKAIAMHELEVTLRQVIASGARILDNKGRFWIIYPVDRLAEVMFYLKESRLEPKSMRFVHPHINAPANRVIIAAIKNGGPELQVGPPLILYQNDGQLTSEVKAFYFNKF